MDDIISWRVIIQGVIIAAVCAGTTGYVSGKVMEVKVNGLRGIVDTIKAELATINAAYIASTVALARLEGMAETVRRLEAESLSMRTRLHAWEPHMGWVDQQRRFDGGERRVPKK